MRNAFAQIMRRECIPGKNTTSGEMPMPDDLEKLLPQLEKVWDAILNGTGESDRRARAVELAELLLQWESNRQLQIGDSLADRLFVGRWCNVSTFAQKRLQDILPFLPATKQKLLSGMKETRDAIASEKEKLVQQKTKLEELVIELQLAETDKAAVTAALMDVQQRLEGAREPITPSINY
jgi:hypothetical protein